MLSRRISELKEPLDTDLQLIADELDTLVNNIRYLCADQMTDANSLDAFNKLIDDVHQEGVEIMFFDDNTSLYEYRRRTVVVHNTLGVFYVLFDNADVRKIEARLKSLR